MIQQQLQQLLYQMVRYQDNEYIFHPLCNRYLKTLMKLNDDELILGGVRYVLCDLELPVEPALVPQWNDFATLYEGKVLQVHKPELERYTARFKAEILADEIPNGDPDHPETQEAKH